MAGPLTSGRPVETVAVPGSENGYKTVRVQLAPEYDMGLFENDFKEQQEPLYGFHVWGPCPQCGHLSRGLVPVKHLSDAQLGDQPMAVAGSEALTRLRTARGTVWEQACTLTFKEEEISYRAVRAGFTLKVAVLACRCLGAHDTAKGSTGCGAEWMVAFEYGPGLDGKEIALSPVRADKAAPIWVAADAVSASAAVAGQTAMGEAGKWITAFGALVALVTLGGVLGGHDAIQALSDRAQVLLGIVTLIALIASACMIYYGNMAGIGYPVLVASPGERSLLQADIEPLRQAQASIDHLNRARSLAVVAALAALVAVGLFLFLPPASAGQVKVKFTDANSIVHQTGCGVLALDSAGQPKSFTPDRGPAVTFNNPASVEVDAC